MTLPESVCEENNTKRIASRWMDGKNKGKRGDEGKVVSLTWRPRFRPESQILTTNKTSRGQRENRLDERGKTGMKGYDTHRAEGGVAHGQNWGTEGREWTRCPGLELNYGADGGADGWVPFLDSSKWDKAGITQLSCPVFSLRIYWWGLVWIKWNGRNWLGFDN